MYMVHVAIFIPLLSLHATIAGFTQPARWSGSNLIIQRNSAGTWCFLPVAGETTAIDCKGDHVDLQGALTAHLKQDLSIAYYNVIDNTRRGGATWSITNATELIHLCASGKGGDGIVQTICSTVNADNQFAGTPYCEVALGPSIVSDGCYSDSPATTAVNSPSSRTSSTSTSTSSPSPTTATSSSGNSPKDSRTSTTSQSTPQTTINVITDSSGPKKTNWVTEVFVPILCALIGVVAAVIGVRKFC